MSIDFSDYNGKEAYFDAMERGALPSRVVFQYLGAGVVKKIIEPNGGWIQVDTGTRRGRRTTKWREKREQRKRHLDGDYNEDEGYTEEYPSAYY